MDAATGYVEVEPQSFLSSEETIKAVEAYELNSLDHGVMIQEYHSDNGSAFTSKAFKANLLDNSRPVGTPVQEAITKMAGQKGQSEL